MNSQTQSVENELDIHKLFQLLWRGKAWIVGLACAFAAVALIYSYLVQQEWTSTASTDKPTVNMLDGYYAQQQFLRNLSARNNSATAIPTTTIADEVYAEFIQQVGAYDTRRAFWLQSDYYQQRTEGDSKADAALLAELIANIQYVPGDSNKNLVNRILLTAETAADANQQLQKYMAFVTTRTVAQLNQELQAQRAARLSGLQSVMEQQEAMANAIYQRELSALEQAYSVRQNNQQKPVSSNTQSDTELLLLSQPVLEARMNMLKAAGPEFDREYYQTKALFNELKQLPAEDSSYQPFRYLRTPEEPIKRSKPRRLFLLILWGGVGAMCGAGVALLRRQNNENSAI